MNTNRDSSQRTKNIRAKTLASYHKGNVRQVLGSYSDTTSGTYTDVFLGLTQYCLTDTPSENTGSSDPTYTTYYISFTTSGSSTWTAPATCQSRITYWIVGGGGGGAGAYDQRGGGGGGGGVAITGTYAVVAGTTYDVFVGAGGAGGTGRGTNSSPPNQGGSDTSGVSGADSGFDVSNGGPIAAGGGEGLDAGGGTGGSGSGGGATTGGAGGGGGRGGGGGGDAGGNGTNGVTTLNAPGGIGGAGLSFTIPEYNGGNAQVYGAGGNGGANRSSGYAVGADGSANTGKGGGGGAAASYQPPYAGGIITMGGDGGSGLVVIQYSA